MWTIFLNNFIDLLILGCAVYLLMLRRFFSSWGEVARGPRSSHSARAPHCGGAQTPGHSGFSSCGSHLQITGSRAAAHRPSCPVACGTVPNPEPEPMSLARAGGLSTTQPPGKPSVSFSNYKSQFPDLLPPRGSLQKLRCTPDLSARLLRTTQEQVRWEGIRGG